MGLRPLIADVSTRAALPRFVVVVYGSPVAWQQHATRHGNGVCGQDSTNRVCDGGATLAVSTNVLEALVREQLHLADRQRLAFHRNVTDETSRDALFPVRSTPCGKSSSVRSP
jgi:hypothetical protein